MASSINSDNGVVSGSSGLKSTADTSGVLALQSNGSTGVTLDTSLNVLVGTTTSAAGKLVVKDTASSNHLWLIGRTSDGASSVSFRNAADSAYSGRIEVDATSGMQFGLVGAAEGMRLTSTGLGIGTSSPSGKLHVYGGAANTNAYITTATSAGYDAFLNIAGGTSGAAAGVYMGYGADADEAAIYRDSSSALVLRANNAERARITSTGAWSFGSSGTAYGTSGQVLTSGGSGAAPTWSTVGGSPWVYISTTTATNAASLAITSGISSTYAMYMFYIEYMYCSSAGQDIYMKWYEGGSLSGNNYNMRTIGTRTYNTTAYDGGLTASSQFYLNRGDAVASTTTLANSLRGTITLFNPSSTDQGLKMMEWDVMQPIYNESSGSTGQSGNVKGFGSGASSGTAVTGIQLSFSSGNIYARVHMYGLKTS